LICGELSERIPLPGSLGSGDSGGGGGGGCTEVLARVPGMWCSDAPPGVERGSSSAVAIARGVPDLLRSSNMVNPLARRDGAGSCCVVIDVGAGSDAMAGSR
jgi:hypothetical protein